MSGLIKSANTAMSVRTLDAARQPGMPPARSAAEEECDRLHARLAALESEARQRDDAVEQLRAEIARAAERGEAEGRRKGRAEAQDHEAERLGAVESGVSAAAAQFGASLSALERLAVLIARDCLETILGNPDSRAEILCDIIRTQLAQIEQSAVLAVDLSAQDFPDGASLQAVGRKLAPIAAVLRATAAVPTGGCVMQLRLGGMEIGIDQQWPALRDLLNDMAEPERVA